MGRVEGKVALITGGARGLGEATGRVMAQEGATVILTDILDAEGETAAKDITANGGKAVYPTRTSRTRPCGPRSSTGSWPSTGASTSW